MSSKVNTQRDTTLQFGLLSKKDSLPDVHQVIVYILRKSHRNSQHKLHTREKI